MILQEIEESLPNGFHDSILLDLKTGFSGRESRFRINLWVGDSNATIEALRERYAIAERVLSETLYLVIEPPRRTSSLLIGEELLMDGGASYDEIQPAFALPDQLPEGAFRYWFYVHPWNSFIHMAAKGAKIVWP